MPKMGQIVRYIGGEREFNGCNDAPALVVRVWSESVVNLKVLGDTSESPKWVTSSSHGSAPGNWLYLDESVVPNAAPAEAGESEAAAASTTKPQAEPADASSVDGPGAEPA